MQSSGVSKHTTPILKGTINFVGSLGNIRLYSLVLVDEKLYKALVRDSWSDDKAKRELLGSNQSIS